MTGQNGSPEQSTPITTEFILPPDTPLSSLIQDNTHVHYPEPPQSSYVETANQFIERMRDIQGKASDSLTKASRRYEEIL